MSRIRRILLIATAVLVAGAALGLGRWQLRRLRDRRANNAALLAARALPPLELTGNGGAVPTIDSGRRVVARGHFEPADQLALRGRVQNDAPGLQIVTPFVLDAGAVLWVLRGFVASADAVTLPDTIPAPAPGTVTITGLALALPVTRDSGGRLARAHDTTWQRLDRTTLLYRRAGSLPVYLLLAGDSIGAGGLLPVPAPVLDDGPHLSYALQWFGIALAVLTFVIIVLWRDGRARPQRPEVP